MAHDNRPIPLDPAARLARRLDAARDTLCESVASQHLARYPELARTLRRLTGDTPQKRMRQAGVDRFHDLVVATLTFGIISLAENDYTWMKGVLPRRGVRQVHHLAMLRTYVAAAEQLPLAADERAALQRVNDQIAAVIRRIYPDA
jgi:hypothetical protein